MKFLLLNILSFLILISIPISLICGFVYTYTVWEAVINNYKHMINVSIENAVITTIIYIIMLFITFKYLIKIQIEREDNNDNNEHFRYNAN